VIHELESPAVKAQFIPTTGQLQKKVSLFQTGSEKCSLLIRIRQPAITAQISIFPMKPLFKKSPIFASLLLTLVLILSGCLVTPIQHSGGIGSVTVTNSNPGAIIAAAQNIFPNYSYTLHSVHYPDSLSFDQASNKTARILWGSYGNPQTMRVKVLIIAIPGSNNYRISPKLYTVSDAGEAGFESKRPLIGLWNSQFSSIFEQIASQASGAGPL
jgi:hypothetical protein